MATLSQLFVGLFSAATGGYSNQFKTSDANSLASVVSMVAGKDLSSDANYINFVLGNMGVTTSSAVYAQAFTAMQGLVTSQGRGNAVVTAVDYLTSQSKDKTSAFFDIANGFLASVAKAEAFTLARPNEVSVSNLVAGVTGSGGAFSLGSGTDTLYGVLGNEVFAGINTATATVIQAADSITDSSTTDSDTLNLTLLDGMTDSTQASTMPTIRNIETINFNVNATTTPAYLSGGTTSPSLFVADASTVTGVKALNFDVIKDVSAVNSVKVIGVANNATVTGSAKIKNITAVPGAATSALTVVNNAVGTTGTPATVTTAVGTADGTDLSVTGAGYLTVTASTGGHGAKGFVSATAAKGLSVTADVAAVVYATAQGGDLTLATGAATIVKGVATGDISITGSGAGSVDLTAGGAITATTLSATSATLSATGTSSLGADSALTSLTLSGNGAKGTFTATDLTGLKNVYVSGASDVALTVAVDKFGTAGTAVNVNDTGAGKLTVTLDAKSGAHVQSVDLSKSSVIDVLAVKADMGESASKTLAVPAGQTITYKVDQGANATTVTTGVAANGDTNVLNVVLDDANPLSGSVDLASVTLTGAKTVNIDASKDLTNGLANPSTITALTAYGSSSTSGANVTVNAGANGLVLAGANDLKANGSLVVTGSGDVSITGTLTAAVLDASAVTGVVSTTTLTAAVVPTITTGAGNDSISLNDSAGTNLTINTNAGDDTLTLPAQDYTNKTVSINLGSGSDTLTLTSGAKLSAGTGKVTLAGVENIVLSNTGSTSIDANLLSGQTYTLKTDAANATVETNAFLLAKTDTNIDLSTVVASTSLDTAIAGQTFLIDGSTGQTGRTAGVTLKGLAGAKNSITGTSFADNLTGGAKDDRFNTTYSALFNADHAMIDTINGGSGNDTLKFTDVDGYTIAATDSWAGLSSVEKLTTANNGTNDIKVTLNANAWDAGLRTVDLSGQTGTGKATVDISGIAGGGMSIVGGGAADTITGSAGNDTLKGGAGADVLKGGNGDNTYAYDAPGDFVTGNAIVDSIVGGTGVDTILLGKSTAAADFTVATGDDWSRASSVEALKAVASGTRYFSVTPGASAFAAGLRTVDISASAATTSNVIDVSAQIGTTYGLTLKGSATGATAITGSAGADVITGGSAADTIAASTGNDTITAGAGNDQITIGGVSQVVDAGAGDDSILTNGTAHALVGTIDGGDGNDTLTLVDDDNISGATVTNIETLALPSAAGADKTVTVSVAQWAAATNKTSTTPDHTVVVFSGDAGTIALSSKAKSYDASAATGAVTITGASTLTGNVVTATGAYDNTVTLAGTTGSDSVTTGAGNDSITISSKAASDTIIAGAGHDTLTFTGSGANGDNVSFTASTALNGVESFVTQQTIKNLTLTFDSSYVATGLITVNGSSLTTGVLAVDGSAIAGTNALSVTGGAGADTLTATDNGDYFNAGAGDDTITGGTGNDTVIGGAGNDSITGDAGDDVINGGAGNDVIDLTTGAGSSTVVFASTAATNGVDSISNFVVSVPAGVNPAVIGDKLDFTAFFGAAPLLARANIKSQTLDSWATGTDIDDFAIAGYAVALNMSTIQANAADLTATDIFNAINGAANAFSLTSGKAVILATDADAQAPKTVVWEIDTALDGAAGLSINDIKQVATLVGVDSTALMANNFVV